MNVAKTEYLVIGKQSGGLITQTGERLMPSAAINYLGYERRTDDTTIAHLKKRTEQATKA